MAPKSAQAGSINVRENLCRIVDSKELRPILERFHERLSEMGAGVSVDGPRVKLNPGAQTDRATASELIAGHMFGTLRFEGFFDSDCMQMAAELGRELNARRAEIMSTRTFLAQLDEMLENWESADDPGSIAKLCLGIYSSTGANPRMALMAEIDNPMLVIEMTKSYISLLLTCKAAPLAPDNDNTERNPAAAGEQNPAGPLADAEAEKPAPAAAGGATGAQEEESKPPIAILEEKLRGLDVGEALLGELLASKYLLKDPAFCVKNLDAFINKHGRDFSLIVLHKNRQILIGLGGRMVENLLEEIRAIREDKPILGKYANLISLLQKELGVPAESAYLMISSLQGTHICETLAIENVGLLLARVPRDKLKRIALSSPHRLAVAREVQGLLDEHRQGVSADQEKLIAAIMESLGGTRPEAFVRAYVCRHLDTISSRSLESAKRKVDYAGRVLIKVSGMAGIAPDFVRKCMEKGIIDSKAIAEAYAATPPAPLRRDELIPPPPPTIRSAAPISGVSETGKGADAGKAPEAETAQVQAATALTAEPPGPAVLQEPGATQAGTEAVPGPAPSATGVADKAEDEKILEAALEERNVPDPVAAQIMALARGGGDAAEALYRFESAAELIIASLEHGVNPRPRIRQFLSNTAHVEALYEPTRKAFFDKVVSFNANIPARQTSSVPPVSMGKNGIRHVNVATGDEQTLQKIRRYPVPTEMIAFFSQSNLDVYELIYVTLKMFRWLNGRQPQDVKKQDYQDNLRRFAGDAQREVGAVHRRMIWYPHNTRIGLLSESSMEPAYADFMKLLKQINFYLLSG